LALVRLLRAAVAFALLGILLAVYLPELASLDDTEVQNLGLGLHTQSRVLLDA
jgi:hypothetical protein